MSFSELKLKAKELLMGKKKNAALVVFVMALITGVISSVLSAIFPETIDPSTGLKVSSPIASLIDSFVAIFLGLGMTSYFMKIARGEDPEIGELFSKGSIFPKALVSSIIAALIVCVGCIALIIPGIILGLAYSLVYYIYIDNPEVGITEVLTQSRTMMKGHKWEYFLLELSFIGWGILGVFTLGILYLWLAPYMGVTIALFYDNIKNGDAETPVKQEEPTSEEE